MSKGIGFEPAGAETEAARADILESTRTTKMARSAHAFVRGNTVQFYEWLEGLDRGTLPEGPAVWICGDCHVGNLGPLASAEGRVDIQIRDLDQTVIGNPAHDIIRLGVSLASAARGSDLPGVTTALMLEEMMRGYALGLADPGDDGAVPEPDVVSFVRREALGRSWRHLARERLENVKPTIPLGKKFWALSPDERAAIKDLFQQPAVKTMVLSLNGRPEDSKLELLDAAYWMKGCSSLGKLRYAALVKINGNRKGKLALVDLKEAVPAAAPAAPGVVMPTHFGERVVAGAKALSPNLGERMMAADFLDRPVVLRELMPEDLKLEIEQFSREQAVKAARYLAFVVGSAHGRQMDDATRATWRRDLAHRRPGNLDAPSWLWSSVIELLIRHEQGYLEHCRRYALRAA
ncbi:DUF2252 family protein [Beijerinckia sp. L45]|uniref:DUF2252 family protein n=1 Tax=Beijerinckia sp. L45 TaxID=1641855 RepID=UPI00131EBD66|nr:DUF2252 family protein [Beijerinckia sp. L45]